MHSHLRSYVVAAIAAVVIAMPFASLAGPGDGNSQGPGGPGNGGGGGGGARSVPEFDPAAAGTIATLLVAGGALIAARRRKG